jgi:hypothetical protein
MFLIAAFWWGVILRQPYRPPDLLLSNLPRIAAILLVWILLICELQLTQVIGFFFYVALLPTWLPIQLWRARSRRRKARTDKIEQTVKLSTNLHVWHVAGLALLLAVVVFWPLPSRLFAGAAAAIGLIPAALLIKRAWVVAMSPADWVLGLKGRAADSYQKWTAEAAKAQAKGELLAAGAQVVQAPEKVVAFLSRGGGLTYRLLVRTAVIIYFLALMGVLLLYLGFESALWLRALADERALASAFGGGDLPNIVEMSLVCFWGIVAQWNIRLADLGVLGSAVVVFGKIIGWFGSVVLIAVFFTHYASDAGRLDQPSTPTS